MNKRIIFKILAILANNNGKPDFSYELISASAMRTTYENWEQLLIALQEEGYIKGLIVDQTLSDPFPRIVEPIKIRITIKGMDYVEDNSVFGDVKRTLKEIGDLSWIGGIIGL